MSSAPVRGITPHRLKRHHNHNHNRANKQRHTLEGFQAPSGQATLEQQTFPTSVNVEKKICSDGGEVGEKRPKVNPIFLWAAQCEQRIIEVRCEDYDKRNRIRLTKTAQGWRSIPRTALTTHSTAGSDTEDERERAIPSVTSKNEGKENSSQERGDIEQKDVGAKQSGKVNDADTLTQWTSDSDKRKVRHKHKRKKHRELWEYEKRRIDSENGNIGTSLNIIRKMKKRRKLFKSKKRKRMCVKEEVSIDSGINVLGAVKIKEESDKLTNDKMTVNNLEIEANENGKTDGSFNETVKPASLESDRKCLDLDKYQNNLHLQPRVVLEQLHLSQLSTRVHVAGVNSIPHPEMGEEVEEIKVVKKPDTSVENETRHDECHIRLETQDYPVNKEDLQEILNMLDSSNIPINIDENKSSLIQTKEISRNCTKLGAAIPSVDKEDDVNLKKLLSRDTQHKSHPVAPKRLNQQMERETRCRVGSKSLDETIQRLERSINYQKRMASIPDHLTVSKVTTDYQNERSSGDSFKSSSCPHKVDYNDKLIEKSLESAEIVHALRNTSGITVSLGPNGRKRSCSMDINKLSKKIASSKESPDSQSGMANEKQACALGDSIQMSLNEDHCERTAGSSEVRIESPESTVNLKTERCSTESERHETAEDEICDSVITEQTKCGDNLRKTPHHGSQEAVCMNVVDDHVDTAKVHSSQLNPKTVFRNSEAQAKDTSQLERTESRSTEEDPNDDFGSHVSPQPSGIPFSIPSSRRSSSATLERLLPSPPCSVSCSEDAKNDRISKGLVLSPLDNIELMSSGGKPGVYFQHGQCNAGPTPSPQHPDNKTDRVALKSDQRTREQVSTMFPLKSTGYLENRNHGRPMSSDSVQNSFTREYISPQRPLSADWSVNPHRMQSCHGFFMNNIPHQDEQQYIGHQQGFDPYVDPAIFLDPASQLRELIKTSGPLIPDPLLVPRDYLPLLASAPLTEIPRLLATRPELRLPEALSRPELLRDPDLLVISLAHLQHVLDHGDRPANHQSHHMTNQQLPSPTIEKKTAEPIKKDAVGEKPRPKLSCKPIGKLMPAPMDLSNNCKPSSRAPLLRVRSGLLKQESEVTSTASSPDDSQLWHPLFGR
ncbi:hypothetical protein QAD02_022227 [Eretmocerus hayati]|uniref:Uncharacterized protein n=1 Tax=Eretmocerus hayati TaxID=131215 RepID=A0ACC2PTH7_9HYME|nr:hypothetical protein QAD02_022227 [Eretmocerus hayati]